MKPWSVWGELESSILCALHLSRGSPQHPPRPSRRSRPYCKVGATHIIFLERDCAPVAAQIVRPNLVDYLPLEGEYLVQDVQLPAAFVGYSIGELRLRTHFNALVIAVRRTVEPSFVFLPSPDYVCESGDTLVMIGRKDDLDTLEGAHSLPPMT